MKNSIVGLVMGIVILFFSLIVLPMYFIGCIQWRDDMNTVQVATRNFVDKVIDTRQISEDTLADFNLSLASCSSNFAYTIYHEQMITNPTDEPNKTITTWVYTDDMVNWNEGDFITVKVEQVSENFFQRISSTMLGFIYSNKTCTLAGMVR